MVSSEFSDFAEERVEQDEQLSRLQVTLAPVQNGLQIIERLDPVRVQQFQVFLVRGIGEEDGQTFEEQESEQTRAMVRVSGEGDRR